MFYNNKQCRIFYRVLIYCNYLKNLRNLCRIPNHDCVFEIYLLNLNKVNFSLLLLEKKNLHNIFYFFLRGIHCIKIDVQTVFVRLFQDHNIQIFYTLIF